MVGDVMPPREAVTCVKETVAIGCCLVTTMEKAGILISDYL